MIEFQQFAFVVIVSRFITSEEERIHETFNSLQKSLFQAIEALPPKKAGWGVKNATLFREKKSPAVGRRWKSLLCKIYILLMESGTQTHFPMFIWPSVFNSHPQGWW
jgi:hypothetical protein